MMALGAQVPDILHLHSTFATGGKELRCVRLIHAFGRSANHAIVSADPARMEAASLLSDEVSVTYPVQFPSLRGRPGLRRLDALAKAMIGYDLVCTYNWGAMDAVMAHRIFAGRYGLPPLIHHEDGFNEDEFARLKRRRNWYRRIALKTVHRLIVPSRILAAIASSAWGLPDGRIARIGNGIPVAAFARPPVPDILPLPAKREGEYWVGTLAGLRKVKNLPRLVHAFAYLSANWKLVIVGDGPEEEAIRHAAERAGSVRPVAFARFPCRSSDLYRFVRYLRTVFRNGAISHFGGRGNGRRAAHRFARRRRRAPYGRGGECAVHRPARGPR